MKVIHEVENIESSIPKQEIQLEDTLSEFDSDSSYQSSSQEFQLELVETLQTIEQQTEEAVSDFAIEHIPEDFLRTISNYPTGFFTSEANPLSGFTSPMQAISPRNFDQPRFTFGIDSIGKHSQSRRYSEDFIELFNSETF